MDVKPQRVVLAQHIGELIGDALGQEDRHPATDADDLDVLDRAQAGQDIFQHLRSQGQRIAAAEQNVAHLGRATQIVQLEVELGAAEIRTRVAHDAAARAVAAVAGTLGGDQHQDAVGVAMDQAGHRTVLVFGQAVFHHAFECLQLAAQGTDLAANRALWIVGIDKAGEVGGNIHPELVVSGQTLNFICRQIDDLRQLVDCVEPVGKLPAPVIPLLVGDVCP